jgi:prepilin-type processing-associated H-X9-DG protein
MPDAPPTPRLSSEAVAGFVLGLLAVCPLNVFAAVPAIAVGYVSLRRINESDGRLRGRGLSIIALVAGLLVCLADLVGLGAVWVFKLRLNAGRAECENNLRMIGETAGMYYDEHRTYPPGTIANTSLKPSDRLSWHVSLLPYYVDLDIQRRKIEKERSNHYPVEQGIDRSKAWNDDANRAATDRVLRAFQCAGDRHFGEDNRTEYVGIAGLGANAAELPLSNPNCGFFGYDRTITKDDMTAGLSYTMMATETALENGPWAQGGFPTVRCLNMVDQSYTGQGRPFGGLHPGIVNILYADGHVDRFRDDAPSEQFAQMATLKRGAE